MLAVTISNITLLCDPKHIVRTITASLQLQCHCLSPLGAVYPLQAGATSPHLPVAYVVPAHTKCSLNLQHYLNW